MSNGQIYPTSLEGDSGAAFSSFEESSTSPVMENLNEDGNNANNAIPVEGDPPHEEVHEEENNPFEKKGRKRTSEVWKDFEEVSLPDGTKKYQLASESTFSAGGRVIDPYRSSLATETVEMLLCGADFVRAQHGLKKRSETEEPTIREIILP